jgi:cytosine/adenosine deaminase-related metal-dependent hydrolase
MSLADRLATAAPPHPDRPYTILARWVVPMAGPPVRDGRVSVHAGRIVAVEPHRPNAPPADLELPEAALLPGLVNAHTHLDLSGLAGQVPPGPDFVGWLRAIVAHRRAADTGAAAAATATALTPAASVQRGLAQLHAAGTALAADILGLSTPVLPASPTGPTRLVRLRELLGLSAARAAVSRQALAAGGPVEGISPHAPYSVGRSLFAWAADLARRERLTVAIHLAESREEIELLTRRRGPLVEFLQELGIWTPDELVSGPAELLGLFADVPRVLWVHGNYLAPQALPAGHTLVYCPRTHAAFGHDPHPWRAFLACGVRVALGTDSLASNPDLDVLAEARWLYRQATGLAPLQLLHLATLAGAEALGYADELGSIAVGKRAALVAVELPAEPANAAEVGEPILAGTAPACWGVPAAR